MVPELTPVNNRALVSGIATAFNWMVAFVVTSTFEPLQNLIQPYGAYLVFMSFTVIGVAVLLGKQKISNFIMFIQNDPQLIIVRFSFSLPARNRRP